MKTVQIRDVTTGKVYTDLYEFVLMLNKEGSSNLIFADMEGIFQDADNPTDYILVDECGGVERLDTARFKIEPRIGA